MQSTFQTLAPESFVSDVLNKKIEPPRVQDAIQQAWQAMAPFWPLKNLIACNPLQGLEDLPFEQALIEGAARFQQATLPAPMEAVNRETIKWCQVFFDEGQATLPMPGRHLGFYRSWLNLAPFDDQLHGSDSKKVTWLNHLSESPETAIEACLNRLKIPGDQQPQFLILLLTTLPGWASYVKYRTTWNPNEKSHGHPVSQAEYLAVRLALTCLLWPHAARLLAWYQVAKANAPSVAPQLKHIEAAETQYRLPLLEALSQQSPLVTRTTSKLPADAQLVFCIDVRSEPFRRAIEAQGRYETLGFAGFFGLPIQIQNEATGETYASCPVLLTPKHTVKETMVCSSETQGQDVSGKEKLSLIRRFYQGLKYSFTTPFALVETLGLWSGAWMLARTVAPHQAVGLKKRAIESIRPGLPVIPCLNATEPATGIPLADQCAYAEGALRMMGLTSNFAPLVVFCGHGSTTENNAYATALDCGACGGNHGGGNAKILAAILNQQPVRVHLAERGISIPNTIWFFGAEHNTTTDDVTLDLPRISDTVILEKLNQLNQDLQSARKVNSRWRCLQMGTTGSDQASARHTVTRSNDWAQTRPEWGLARNAAFIVAPRELTRHINLEGRSFLHSYDWQQDPQGSSLTTILTAPMVVAQWINTQYLFSTLDNVAFGSGSKITHNITGKLGIMQGNGSDLMHGLPLQSIYRTDTEAYHQPLRLMTVVYAPRWFIDGIIERQEVLRKLFGNGWVTLACIEPEDQQPFILQRDLTWKKALSSN